MSATTHEANFIEQLRDAFFVLDAEWNFIYMNRMAEECLFAAREGLLGKNLWTAFPGAVGTLFEREYRRVMAEGVISQFEEYYPFPLNRWYHVTASPCMEGLAVQFRDVTETRQALLQSQEAYRSLFEHHPDAVCAVTKDGIIRSVNPAMLRLYGYSADEILKLDARRLCAEENLIAMERRFRAAAAGTPQKYETYAYAKDGRRLDLHVTLVPIHDGNGGISGVFGISKDISERKHAEEQLRRSEANLRQALERLHDTEALFRLISEHAQDAITLSTPDGIVQYMSPGVTGLTGYTPEEVVGRKRTDFYHVEDHPKVGVPEGQESFVSVNRIRHKDGHYVWIETSQKLIRDERGNVVNILGIGRDVSIRVEAEELMLKSEKLKLTGQLAAGIAHEIRNPLTAIKGFLQFMRTGHAFKPEYVDVMGAELKRIETILTELLLLAKPNATSFARKDLTDIVGQVVTLMETEAHLTGTELVLRTDGEALPIECDENRLKQVFINFVKNGIEAMPKGGKLNVETRREGVEAVLTFADEGVGIPEETLRRIGQPFFTTKEKGTGLGLAVSFTIVESHRGTVSIESEVGKGTTITVRLPLLPASLE